mmetsp:Transcript_3999/g.11303  ORF Transcript_3999/g.11303 Transcript_3999/m.11303 type:complete len:209 (-) Transcript_3999:881-1507(-)
MRMIPSPKTEMRKEPKCDDQDASSVALQRACGWRRWPTSGVQTQPVSTTAVVMSSSSVSSSSNSSTTCWRETGATSESTESASDSESLPWLWAGSETARSSSEPVSMGVGLVAGREAMWRMRTGDDPPPLPVITCRRPCGEPRDMAPVGVREPEGVLARETGLEAPREAGRDHAGTRPSAGTRDTSTSSASTTPGPTRRSEVWWRRWR